MVLYNLLNNSVHIMSLTCKMGDRISWKNVKMENLYLVIGTNSKVVLASMVLEFVLTLLLLLNILVSLIHTCSILHCVKCVRIRSYSVFSPNAGKWGKNMDQNISEYGHFLCSVDKRLSGKFSRKLTNIAQYGIKADPGKKRGPQVTARGNQSFCKQ